MLRFREHSALHQLQRLKVYNIMLSAMSFVHDKEAKSIIDNDYFIRYIAVKSRTLYRLVIYHKR